MSDFQVARFAEVQASAKAASAAAEPELLAVLDSGAFRAALAACCPAFAGESAASLLGTLVGEMGAAEICTGIRRRRAGRPGLVAVRPGLLVSAIDTGEWTALCNHTDASPAHGAVGDWHPYPHDCGAYDFSLGTLDHFSHLFLPNARYWAGPNATAEVVAAKLARTFRLLAEPWSAPIAGPELIHYWEAMPAMTLPLAASVRFAIASFPSLFGTDAGDELRSWCAARGWPSSGPWA
ncbi:hypothetical protein JL721_5974 [Aureococcus anophagefferens]|nr:hypothetical protein JL721_5974 [Aureococcus anophagefferens]